MITHRHRLQGTVWASVAIASTLLGSCSAAMQESSTSAPQAALAPADGAADIAESANEQQRSETLSELNGAEPPSASRPAAQLIRTVSLELRVDGVEDAIQQVTQIVRAQQGDLLGLQDSSPQDGGRRSAYVKLRVPQQRLDATVEALSKLGTVQNRSIQAEDVANQLVDFESRLRNLKRSEETVLKIMDRSGSVADVLKVSQELNNIRNEIEKIQGQQQYLKQKVAFSSIDLTLAEAIAQQPQGTPVGTQIKNSWTNSTSAVGSLTVNLLQLGVWLVVFSPYWLGLGVLIWGGRRLLRRPQPRILTPDGGVAGTNLPES